MLQTNKKGKKGYYMKGVKVIKGIK